MYHSCEGHRSSRRRVTRSSASAALGPQMAASGARRRAVTVKGGELPEGRASGDAQSPKNATVDAGLSPLAKIGTSCFIAILVFRRVYVRGGPAGRPAPGLSAREDRRRACGHRAGGGLDI